MMNKYNTQKRNDAASVVADWYGVTASYVRKIIADSSKEKYKGPNPEAIRKAYSQYLKGKTKLIECIEQKIKVA